MVSVCTNSLDLLLSFQDLGGLGWLFPPKARGGGLHYLKPTGNDSDQGNI